MAREISYEVKKRLGTVYSTIRGRRSGDEWTKQVNIVAWNGGIPKIDIRDWNEDYTRMGKGITLTEEEAREVMEILTDYFTEKGE